MPFGAAAPAPPRPQVKVGALLVIGGAVLSFVGVFLPWLTASGQTGNGMDDYLVETEGSIDLIESPGLAMIVGAVILLGLGVTLLVAGRVLAVAIIAIVAASIGFVVGMGMVGVVAGTMDLVGSGSYGVGVILQPIGPLVALAGSITATAKRRRSGVR